jgi:hypothetical protein
MTLAVLLCFSFIPKAGDLRGHVGDPRDLARAVRARRERRRKRVRDVALSAR